jgi:hypothetical protein
MCSQRTLSERTLRPPLIRIDESQTQHTSPRRDKKSQFKMRVSNSLSSKASHETLLGHEKGPESSSERVKPTNIHCKQTPTHLEKSLGPIAKPKHRIYPVPLKFSLLIAFLFDVRRGIVPPHLRPYPPPFLRAPIGLPWGPFWGLTEGVVKCSGSIVKRSLWQATCHTAADRRTSPLESRTSRRAAAPPAPREVRRQSLRPHPVSDATRSRARELSL